MVECFFCRYPKAKIFDLDGIVNNSAQYITSRFQCLNCGDYEIESDFKDDIYKLSDSTYTTLSPSYGNSIKINSYEFFRKAPCIAAERKLHGRDKYLLFSDIGKGHFPTAIHVSDFLKEFPENPVDILERALLNLGRINKDKPFSSIKLSKDYETYLIFATDQDEFNRIVEALEKQDFILCSNGALGINSVELKITAAGWKKIVELEEKHKVYSDKAFVAMWYDKQTEPFREAVREAIKSAGYDYKEITVDEKAHNDFIMNKVLNMIDDAKFVIADFTCKAETSGNGKTQGGVRGGVYFEAGYAKGQGKPVIMTCQEDDDSKNRRHFDINQHNTIFWEMDGRKVITSPGKIDFSDYLKEWIIQSVGKGPHYER